MVQFIQSTAFHIVVNVLMCLLNHQIHQLDPHSFLRDNFRRFLLFDVRQLVLKISNENQFVVEIPKSFRVLILDLSRSIWKLVGMISKFRKIEFLIRKLVFLQKPT